MARSLSTVDDASYALLPRFDALDDVQVLARAHVAELARLASESAQTRRRCEPPLQLALLRSELRDLRATRGEFVPRLEVRAQRVVVEVRDDRDGCNGRPAARERGEGRTAGRAASHGRSPFGSGALLPTPRRP